jgi:hypothetical protein
MRKLLATAALIASAGAVFSLSACNDKKAPTHNPATIASTQPSEGWMSVSPEPSESVTPKHSISHSPSHSVTHSPSHHVTHSVNPSASKVLHFSASPDADDPYPNKP